MTRDRCRQDIPIPVAAPIIGRRPCENWQVQTVHTAVRCSSSIPGSAPFGTPLVLDHAEDMLRPGASPITLSIEGLICAVQLSASCRFAQYPPGCAACFRFLLAGLADVSLVSVDHLLLAMQTFSHHINVMHTGAVRFCRVHQPLRVRTHMGFHTKMPLQPLLCR